MARLLPRWLRRSGLYSPGFAGGLANDLRGLARAETLDQRRHAFAVARDGEGLPRRSEMHVQGRQRRQRSPP
ncbi:MAG: hypothetical protein JNM30_14030 [Rhodospirillales bacterium]|nr:hypothetical protein [Rhodospirillales bacterium]